MWVFEKFSIVIDANEKFGSSLHKSKKFSIATTIFPYKYGATYKNYVTIPKKCGTSVTLSI